ncbi:LLM class flavin-dependent oxidoreductase [Microbacterium protaetiae]|uniref:LLM class flavin-dependent oxidoreductase n=1 Tax=Microbacterium protaetiae TaxID=2509458 RepID=A0A4V0YCW4_9MICO|nr:LLM class flavin-dependent oxidoreductase [Microbacterium protaetiae]QAY58621.1 LLM class flavin-dependent oxidoreductase [Microbacterium protaetiae]
MTSVGAIFSPYPNPPEAFHEAVLAAEDAGLDTLWVWEDCFRSSAFAAASAALAWTEHLRIGIGIAPMPLRNVAANAMEIATIERMFPGRLMPGVGHGVLAWMGQVGARVASPLTLMREYVPALRALLAGENVTVAGRYVTLDQVRLAWPPAAPPRVYAAAEGPKTLVAAGEVADGVVLDMRHTVDEVATAVQAVRASNATRHVVAYVVAAFGEDAAARAIAVYGDDAPDDAADRVLAGSVAEVAAGVLRFAAAGVDHVVLMPPNDAPLAAYYADAAEVGRLVGSRS